MRKRAKPDSECEEFYKPSLKSFSFTPRATKGYYGVCYNVHKQAYLIHNYTLIPYSPIIYEIIMLYS
jgi:hypothetical protein